MKKSLLIFAFLYIQVGITQPKELVSNTIAVVHQNTSECPKTSKDDEACDISDTAFEDSFYISTLEFIEDDVIDLGFDPKKYLPAGFDPHLPFNTISEIPFIEEEINVDLGVDYKRYLPAGFDAHLPEYGISAIPFIEEEIDIDLGFDPKKYLPVGFDPYAKPLIQTP